MDQAIEKSTTVTTPSKPIPKISDVRRLQSLNDAVRFSINSGGSAEATLKCCQKFNAWCFENPLPTDIVESHVKAAINTSVLTLVAAAEGAAERAETDPDKVVATLNKKFVWLSRPMAIYDLESRCIVKKDSLKDHYANTSVMLMTGDKEKRCTHFDAWMQSKVRREHVDVIFAPGCGQIVNNHINVWKRWATEPVVGDVSPWNDLLDHLYGAGSSERTWAEQWFAYPIQNPGKKMHTAMVIWGAQGVGKTLVAECVGRLYAGHFKTITDTLLKSKYNGWAHDALLVFGEEKNHDQRAEANKLKQLVTGPTVFIEEKYRSAFECRNQMNFIFTSNHADALALDGDDRRYFVWNAATPKLESAFYDEIAAWAKSAKGMAALMHHMLHVDMAGFDPHGPAPMTKAKLAMIELSKSDLDQWVADAMTDDYIDNHIRREIVTLAELVHLYQRDTGAVRTTPKAMSMALRKKLPDYAQDRISVRGKRPQVVTLRNHAKWAVQDRADWSVEFTKASPVLH